jgi:hypothetical protein
LEGASVTAGFCRDDDDDDDDVMISAIFWDVTQRPLPTFWHNL